MQGLFYFSRVRQGLGVHQTWSTSRTIVEALCFSQNVYSTALLKGQSCLRPNATPFVFALAMPSACRSWRMSFSNFGEGPSCENISPP